MKKSPTRSLAQRRHAKLAWALLVATLAAAGAPDRSLATTTGYGGEMNGAGDSAVESGVRKVWDVLFWRPIYVVQLVGGVAALPVALPLSVIVGSWRDGIDMCITGPAEMAFGRPLGE